MSRKRKTKGPKPTLPPVRDQRPPLDPDTGLPPVGQGLPGEADRILRRARAKHAHKLRDRR